MLDVFPIEIHGAIPCANPRSLYGAMLGAILDIFLEAILGVIWDVILGTNWEANRDANWDAN